MSSERVEALRQAVALAPDNHLLRQMLAETLQSENENGAALVEYATLLQVGALSAETLIAVGNLALDEGDINLAGRCLDAALQKGHIDGTATLRKRIDVEMEKQGYLRVMEVPAEASELTLNPEPTITFADVGGLDAIKKAIHRLIILPFMRPELYRKYGRKSGGGVLMYGAPGCGKTMLARATAGECGLPFVNIRIEDILDPYIGISERNLHRAFEYARANAPCVIFLDEIDALGFARRKRSSSVGRSLVDQLLQELDAVGSDNRNLLVLGATNAPWDIDDALLRPGRFDKRLFVPPPDAEARRRILEIQSAEIPHNQLNFKRIAKETALFSGADLQALLNSAVDLVIDEALETGNEPPLTNQHFERVTGTLRPTTLEWLSRARNYVEFANDDDRYDEVAKFLKSREVRKRLR